MNKLTVAVSSRALFSLEQENDVFENNGVEAYEKQQRENESVILSPGPAFPLVQAMSSLGDKAEVVLVSRATADISIRFFHSVESYGLRVDRGFFTGGESVVPYLMSIDADLYLTVNQKSAQDAVDAGIPAAVLLPGNNYGGDREQLRIAFDGDAVLFSDDSEAIFKKDGIERFYQNEREKAEEPMAPGPMQKFLLALAELQKQEGGDNIKTALVTSRSSAGLERVVRTLRDWGVRMNEAFFLGGAPKNIVLENFRPQIFFDDQHVHTVPASKIVPAATVPYKKSGKIAEEHAENLSL